MHGTWNIGGASAGTMNITGGFVQTAGLSAIPTGTAINGLQFTVGNGGTLTTTTASTLGFATNQAVGQSTAQTTSSLTVNSGGNVTTAGALNVRNTSAQTATTTFNTLQVNGGTFSNSGVITVGSNVANTFLETNAITVAGGTLTVTGGAINLGNSGGSGGRQANTLTVSSGAATIGTSASSQNLTVGNTTNAVTGTTITNTANLSGGKLLVSGTVSAALGTGTANTNITTTAGSATATVSSTTGLALGQVISGNPNIPGGTTIIGFPTSTTITLSTGVGVTAGSTIASTTTGAYTATNTFNWSGGQLTAGTVTPSAGFNGSYANPTTAGGITTTGLVNGGSLSGGGTLAPGDIGTAGRTTINGGYTQNVGGTLAIDLGGSTIATGFQGTAAQYDNLSVTGATALGGRLNFSLTNSYAPLSATNHNIVVGTTAGATGTFTNQVVATSGNSRLVGADGLTSFLIATNTGGSAATVGGLTSVAARTTALGGYQASNTYSGAGGTAWDTANAGAWTSFDPGATATPATQASGAIAQFADGTASIGAIGISLSSTRNIQGIQFSSAVGSRAYTISGSGTVILDNTANNASATIADTSTSGTANAVNVPITLNSNLVASVTNAANTLTIGGDISGTGKSLTKTGDGTLALTASNTYTGATNINGGKLIMGDATADTFATSNVTVANAATLGGSGTVSGTATVQFGGIHSVGAVATGGAEGVGKQSFSSTVTYSTGSIFEWSLAAVPSETGRGTSYDAVNAASLGSTTGAIFRVVLNDTQDFTSNFWDSDRTWSDIFKTVDEVSSLSIASIFSGTVQYYNGGGTTLASISAPTAQGAFTFSGTDLKWSAVPEPSSALAGLLIAAGLLRRRRSA